MATFVDYVNKIIFITSPKCGTTTISAYLNSPLNLEYKNKYEIENNNNTNLFLDNTFTNIIIYREDIIDRFLSGFYEDLFNNSCYNNVDVTFDQYLSFLHYCSVNKIPNLNNMNTYLNKDIPIWFGNCSYRKLNITDDTGTFISHIQSQSYGILYILNTINEYKCKKVKIIELNDLNKIIPNEKYNVKNKSKHNINLSNTLVCDLKKNNIICSKKCLTDKHIELILEIYKEDIDLIHNLKNNYEYY